jgi:hypothetical protein
MPYKSKTVTKKRTEYRTRTIPGVGIETYAVEVPYTTTEQVWEPDTSSSSSSDYSSGGGYE